MKQNKCSVYGRAFSLLVVFFCSISVAEVVASNDVTAKNLNSATTLIGKARMSYLWWKIYDIQLFAETSTWSPNRGYALKLNYLVDIKGRKIAEQTIREIEKIGPIDEATSSDWLKMLNEIFPDVKKGDALTGVYTRDKTTMFYINDTQLYEVKDPLFAEVFFGIWLDEKTSQPELRRKLLGG